jgi:hypothetical protein
MTMIARFEADLERGVMVIVPFDVLDVFSPRHADFGESHDSSRMPCF